MNTNFANFHPKKSLGQNFLINQHIVEKIIKIADLKCDETVVEVGPGFGVLTKELLKHCKRVIAIEKDERLYMSLRGTSEASDEAIPYCHCEAEGRSNLANDHKNVTRLLRYARNDTKRLTLLHADALKVPPPSEPYVLVANIPYSITSPLLDHFIRDNPKNLPLRAVLMVQKEVAEKLCTAPPRMNVLALHVQTFGIPKIISYVSKNNFNPKPKVDSAIIKIEFHDEWKSIQNLDKYFGNIHKAFSHKRKMLRTVFDEEMLKKADIEPTRRPETVTMKEWSNFSHEK